MDIGIKLYMMMIFGAIILMIQTDFISANIIMEESVLNNDLTSRQTIEDLINKKDFEESSLTEKEIIEKWLINYIDNYNLNLEEVVLNFDLVHTSPQVLLVTIEGYSERLVIRKGSKVSYQTGVLVEENK
jgi:hypothetical protein